MYDDYLSDLNDENNYGDWFYNEVAAQLKQCTRDYLYIEPIATFGDGSIPGSNATYYTQKEDFMTNNAGTNLGVLKFFTTLLDTVEGVRMVGMCAQAVYYQTPDVAVIQAVASAAAGLSDLQITNMDSSLIDKVALQLEVRTVKADSTVTITVCLQ